MILVFNKNEKVEHQSPSSNSQSFKICWLLHCVKLSHEIVREGGQILYLRVKYIFGRKTTSQSITLVSIGKDSALAKISLLSHDAPSQCFLPVNFGDGRNYLKGKFHCSWRL